MGQSRRARLTERKKNGMAEIPRPAMTMRKTFHWFGCRDDGRGGVAVPVPLPPRGGAMLTLGGTTVPPTLIYPPVSWPRNTGGGSRGKFFPTMRPADPSNQSAVSQFSYWGSTCHLGSDAVRKSRSGRVTPRCFDADVLTR